MGATIAATNPFPLLEALLPDKVVMPTVYKFTVKKFAAKIKISDELLLDAQFDLMERI